MKKSKRKLLYPAGLLSLSILPLFVIIFYYPTQLRKESQHYQNYSNSGFIEIRNNGESDKPITTTVICLERRKKIDFQRNIIINKKSFQLIDEFIKKSQIKEEAVKEAHYFYAFQITSCISKKTAIYSLKSKQSAIQWFTELKLLIRPIQNEPGIKELLNETDWYLNILQN